MDWAKQLLQKDCNKSKALWQASKQISGDAQQAPTTSLLIDNVTTTSPKDIANALNSHFVNKVDKMVKNMPIPKKDILFELLQTPTPAGDQMVLMSFSATQLKENIRKMKKNAACGSDSISGKVLFDIFEPIQQILLHLINLSLCAGIYPEMFKQTKIIPLAKAGKDPLDVKSYRPISNLCAIGKQLELAFFGQVTAFLTTTNQVNARHHGGRKGHSTTTCVVELLSSINEGINDKLKVGMIAVDMSAAFDLCNHGILLQKIRMLKLGDDALAWITSFLGDRYQFVEINGTRSELLKMGAQGVVQGGSSSCELFTIYINDLPNQINHQKTDLSKDDSNGQGYVDDFSIVAKAASEEALKVKMIEEYEAVSVYLENHLMVVNKEKTQVMFINPDKKQPPPTIQIQGCEITHQPVLKILGILLADNLSMDTHICQNMIKSINSKTALIRALKQYIPTEDLAVIGSALIDSTISYGAPIWGITTKSNIERVQKYQTKAARLIARKGWERGKKKEHRQDLLQNLGWQNVQQIVTASILNLTKNSVDKQSSNGLNSMFTVKHPSNPRQGSAPRIAHKQKITANNKVFEIEAPSLFNNLPVKLRDTNLNKAKFKKELKAHISTQHLLEKH